MRTVRHVYGLVISLAGFAFSINIIPSLVSTLGSGIGISMQSFGIAFSAQYALFFLSTLLIGYAAKKNRLLRASTVVAALIVTAVDLCSIGSVDSYPKLLILMMVIGVCGGTVESVSSALIAEREERGTSRYLNLSQLFYCLGAILAPAVVASIIAKGVGIAIFGWFFGVLLLVIAGFVMMLTRTRDERQECDDAKDQLGSRSRGRKRFLVYLLSMFLYVLAESSIASWLPWFSEIVKGFSQEKAPLALSCFWAGLALGRFFYVVKIPTSFKRCLLLHAAGAAVLSISLFIARSEVVIILMILSLGFCCGPVWPMLVSGCRDDLRDSALIPYLVGAGSIGALCGPSASSFLTGTFGESSLTLLCGVIFALVTVCMVMLSVQRQPARAVEGVIG